MKRFLLILSIVSFNSFQTKAQNVGIGTDTPDSSAQLEVKSSSKGFLPPRIALSATNNSLPVTNPATGLIVYNTASAGVSPDNVRPGYYYWDGIKWASVENKANAYGDMQFWNGTNWVTIPLGLNGQVLTICGGIPLWTTNGSCQTKLTLQPASNPYELNYNNYNPNQPAGGPATQMAIQAWTANGASLISRQMLKFDYSAIPLTAIIDSARLFLFSADNAVGGNGQAQFGTNNACYIQRITSAWTVPTTITWNNQPAVTTTNQAIIPQSVISNSDNIINVTALVQDMLANGNNGFQIKLQNEVIYNIRQYTGSTNSNTTKHPVLEIYYH